MPQLTPSDLALLADYFADEVETENVDKIERWINATPERRRFVDDLLASRLRLASADVRGEAPLNDRVEEIVAGLSDIRARDRQLQTPAPTRSVRGGTAGWTPGWARGWNRGWYALAGSVAAAALLFTGWIVRGERSSNYGSATTSTYATGLGERARVTLPDGSTILLNVASTVKVPTNYLAGNRTVTLSGEALFTVKHSSGSPFTVVSGNSTTRVLGTSFTVRHYEGDSVASIAVREGKVAVGSLVLSASQATTVDGRKTSKLMNATPSQFGFARGVLVLEYTSLPQAIKELNRWYDADIRLGDRELMTKRIVGEFEAGSLTDIISILEMTFDVRIVREGRILTLYRRS